MEYRIQTDDFNYTYRLVSCQKAFEINLKDQFEKKKPKGNVAGVTRNVAIKILKNIEIKAKIKAFFSKPVVVISIAAALLAGGLALSIISGAVLAPFAAIVAMKVMGLLFTLPGALLLPYAVQGKCNGSLDEASHAYSRLAHAARVARTEIKSNQNFTSVR